MKFKLHKLVPHSCCEVAQRALKIDSTQYTNEQLAPLLVDELQQKPTLGPKEARPTLQSCCQLELPASKIQSVIDEARRGGVTKSPLETVKLLPVALNLLAQQGHQTKLIEVDQATMAKLREEDQKSLHEALQKKLPAKEKTKWADVKDEVLNELPPLTAEKYVLGWIFCPVTSQEMHKKNIMHPVSSADFCHMTGRTKGCLGTVTSLDPDHHCVPPTYIQMMLNEGGTPWYYLFTATKAVLNDCPERRIITDQDKGCASMMKQVMKDAQPFYDSKHRGDNVAMAQNGAKAGGDLYKKMVYASLPVSTLHTPRAPPPSCHPSERPCR